MLEMVKHHQGAALRAYYERTVLRPLIDDFNKAVEQCESMMAKKTQAIKDDMEIDEAARMAMLELAITAHRVTMTDHTETIEHFMPVIEEAAERFQRKYVTDVKLPKIVMTAGGKFEARDNGPDCFPCALIDWFNMGKCKFSRIVRFPVTWCVAQISPSTFIVYSKTEAHIVQPFVENSIRALQISSPILFICHIPNSDMLFICYDNNRGCAHDTGNMSKREYPNKIPVAIDEPFEFIRGSMDDEFVILRDKGTLELYAQFYSNRYTNYGTNPRVCLQQKADLVGGQARVTIYQNQVYLFSESWARPPRAHQNPFPLNPTKTYTAVVTSMHVIAVASLNEVTIYSRLGVELCTIAVEGTPFRLHIFSTYLSAWTRDDTMQYMWHLPFPKKICT